MSEATGAAADEDGSASGSGSAPGSSAPESAAREGVRAPGISRALAYGLVVVASSAVLVLEILVSRLVAPYIGLTLETYTAAIGVALAAIAGGSAAGGVLADRVSPRRWLGWMLALGGGLVCLVRPVVSVVGPDLRGSGTVGTVVLVAAAIAPAAFVLSLVPPGVVRLRLRSLAATGRTVGGLSAAGTLGALAGTFLTGFVLISALPTSQVLLGTGVVLGAGGVILGVAMREGRIPDSLVVAVASVTVLAGAGVVFTPEACEHETRYYCANLVEDPARAQGVTLVLDGLEHSYVDLADPLHLEFSYAQRIADVIATMPAGALEVVHIGLGGGTLPRYLSAVRPGSSHTVFEVDPELVALDRTHLELDEVPQTRVVVGDARTSIASHPSDSADVVVGDAFGSLAVPWHLTTREMLAEVDRVLRPGGVYVLNMIDLPPLAFARAEAQTFLAQFAHVTHLGPAAQLRGEVGGNLVLAGSAAGLDLAGIREQAVVRGHTDWVHERGEVARFAGGAQVLTDDDAPVDQLLTTPSY